MDTKARPVGQNFFHDIHRDLKLLLSYEGRKITFKNILWALFACDAYMVLLTFRLRKLAKKYRIPFANRILRFLQTTLYAIELGIEIELGHGVYFVHTVGTVVGGDAIVGEACVFFGNNTIGAARFRGSPELGPYTVIGAGVRVVGTIKVGANCFLGANTVVVKDVPDDKIVVGIPGRVIADNDPIPELQRTRTQTQAL